jgi:hypothetical protein
MPSPGESDVADAVLVELDKQEIFIRQLARRIDRGDKEHPLIELQVSRDLLRAFEYIHADAYATREHAPLPDPVLVVLARAKAQALASATVAKRIKALDGVVDVGAIERRLQRARDGMPHRLEELVTDEPEITRSWIARDFHELIYNPQQEILLELDEALTDVEVPGE